MAGEGVEWGRQTQPGREAHACGSDLKTPSEKPVKGHSQPFGKSINTGSDISSHGSQEVEDKQRSPGSHTSQRLPELKICLPRKLPWGSFEMENRVLQEQKGMGKHSWKGWRRRAAEL